MYLHSTLISLSYNFKLLFKCQEAERFYKTLKAEFGPFFDAIFDNDEVFLDIPREGTTLPSGWTILPLVYPPRVRKLGRTLYFQFYLLLSLSFCDKVLTATHQVVLYTHARLS